MNIEEALYSFEQTGKSLVMVTNKENYPIQKGEIGRVLSIRDRYNWVDLGEEMEIRDEKGETPLEPPRPPYYIIQVKWPSFYKMSTYTEEDLNHLGMEIFYETPQLTTSQLSLPLL